MTQQTLTDDYRAAMPALLGEIVLRNDYLLADDTGYRCKSVHHKSSFGILKKHKLWFVPLFRTAMPFIAQVDIFSSNGNEEKSLHFTVYGEEYLPEVEALQQQVAKVLGVPSTASLQPPKKEDLVGPPVGG